MYYTKGEEMRRYIILSTVTTVSIFAASNVAFCSESAILVTAGVRYKF